jgi:hypothetical protein
MQVASYRSLSPKDVVAIIGRQHVGDVSNLQSGGQRRWLSSMIGCGFAPARAQRTETGRYFTCSGKEAEAQTCGEADSQRRVVGKNGLDADEYARVRCT